MNQLILFFFLRSFYQLTFSIFSQCPQVLAHSLDLIFIFASFISRLFDALKYSLSFLIINHYFVFLSILLFIQEIIKWNDFISGQDICTNYLVSLLINHFGI